MATKNNRLSKPIGLHRKTKRIVPRGKQAVYRPGWAKPDLVKRK